MLGTVLIVVLVLMLLGVVPTWPHSRNWGYGPSGVLGLVLIILLVLLLMDVCRSDSNYCQSTYLQRSITFISLSPMFVWLVIRAKVSRMCCP